jgi:hypothetical protein
MIIVSVGWLNLQDKKEWKLGYLSNTFKLKHNYCNDERLCGSNYIPRRISRLRRKYIVQKDQMLVSSTWEPPLTWTLRFVWYQTLKLPCSIWQKTRTWKSVYLFACVPYVMWLKMLLCPCSIYVAYLTSMCSLEFYLSVLPTTESYRLWHQNAHVSTHEKADWYLWNFIWVLCQNTQILYQCSIVRNTNNPDTRNFEARGRLETIWYIPGRGMMHVSSCGKKYAISVQVIFV